eukprot:9002941-Prorocentrum_lima.AAC.1
MQLMQDIDRELRAGDKPADKDAHGQAPRASGKPAPSSTSIATLRTTSEQVPRSSLLPTSSPSGQADMAHA